MISHTDLDNIVEVLVKHNASAFRYKNGEEEIEIVVPGKVEIPDDTKDRKRSIGFNNYEPNFVTFDDAGEDD